MRQSSNFLPASLLWPGQDLVKAPLSENSLAGEWGRLGDFPAGSWAEINGTSVDDTVIGRPEQGGGH